MESGKNTCRIAVVLIDRWKNNYDTSRNIELYHYHFRYGIDQMSPKVIFTSQHLVPKLQTILSSFPNTAVHHLPAPGLVSVQSVMIIAFNFPSKPAPQKMKAAQSQFRVPRDLSRTF